MSAGVREKLLEFVSCKGLSQRQFYLKTGLSTGFLTKGKSIGSENIKKIVLAYPEIRLEWLILGTGHMLKSSMELRSKEEISSFLPLLDISTVVKEPDISYGNEAIEPSDLLYLGKNYKDCSTAVQIWGDSMRPEFFPGDIAILKLIPNLDYIQWGFTHLVITDKQHFFNRVQRSDNPNKIRMITAQTETDFFEIKKSDIVRVYESRAMLRRLMI